MSKKSNPLDVLPTEIENKTPTTSSRQLQGNSVKFSSEHKGEGKNIFCFEFQLEDTAWKSL